MKDREFLMWIHARLTEVHKESPIVDYMHKLRAIIESTDKDKITPNVLTCNSLDALEVILEDKDNESI